MNQVRQHHLSRWNRQNLCLPRVCARVLARKSRRSRAKLQHDRSAQISPNTRHHFARPTANRARVWATVHDGRRSYCDVVASNIAMEWARGARLFRRLSTIGRRWGASRTRTVGRRMRSAQRSARAFSRLSRLIWRALDDR